MDQYFPSRHLNAMPEAPANSSAASEMAARASQPVASIELSARHLAFMRAVIQGMDPGLSWTRYLALEGVTATPEVVRQSIAWINDVFTAAACRHGHPDLARLLRTERPGARPPGSTLPTLAAFVKAHDLDNFSEAEQLDAYRIRFGAAERRHVRQTRLAVRRLEALRWLEQQPVEKNVAADNAASWLPPVLAARLEANGLHHFAALQHRVMQRGTRWWHGIAGIGPVKAARIIDLLNHLRRGSQADSTSGKTETIPVPSALETSRIRPLQQLAATESTVAAAGWQAVRPESRIAATTDLEALRTWLHAKRGRGEAAALPGKLAAVAVPDWTLLQALSHTQRAYWKEAERFQLWLCLTRGSTLSLAVPEDCRAYLSFLHAPAAPWCGRRAQGRHEATWRPFTGPLSPRARRFAGDVLRSLYRFLVRAGYLTGNPWNDVPFDNNPPSTAKTAVPPASRVQQASPVNGEVTCADRRLQVARMLQRDTCLSAEALVRLTVDDLLAPPAESMEWRLRVRPRGANSNSAQLPRQLRAASVIRLGEDTVAALRAYLGKRGVDYTLPRDVNGAVYLLGRASDIARLAPWSPWARQPFDAACGIAAGTLRDQLRTALRAAVDNQPLQAVLKPTL